MKPLLFALLLTVPTLSGNYARAEVGVTDKEIVIGSCAPLSGSTKELGLTMLGGAAPYIQYVNKELGGVRGRQIKLLSYDDQYDAEKGIECFNRLMKEDVFAAAFLTGSATGAKYVLMAERHQIPLFSGSAAPFITEPLRHYVFGLRASYNDEVDDVIRHLWEDLGMRRIAVILQNDSAGANVLAAAKRSLETRKASLAAVGSFDPNTTAVDSAVRAVRNSNPEAVLLACHYLPAAAIAKASKTMGWNPLFVLGTSKVSFAKEAGDASEGVVFFLSSPPPNKTEFKTVALFQKVMKKYAPKTAIDAKTFDGFLQAMVFVEGLRRAGKEPTRDTLVDALESMSNFDMGLGPRFKLHYSKDTHKGFTESLYGVFRGGQEVLFDDWSAMKRRQP